MKKKNILNILVLTLLTVNFNFAFAEQPGEVTPKPPENPPPVINPPPEDIEVPKPPGISPKPPQEVPKETEKKLPEKTAPKKISPPKILKDKNQQKNMRPITPKEQPQPNFPAAFFLNIISRLEKALSFAQSITDQEDKNLLIGRLKSDISFLKVQYTEKNLKSQNIWQEKHINLKKEIGLIQFKKNSQIISKQEEAAQKIVGEIIKGKEQKKDTNNLEEMLSNFNNNISKAKEKAEKAKNNFDDISLNSENNHLLLEGKNNLDEAHKYSMESYSQINKAIAILKEIE